MGKLSRNQIRTRVVNALAFVMGDGETSLISDETDPVNGLGLDSHHGIEFACELSAELGLEIPLDDNPFYKDREGHTNTVADIIDYVLLLQSNFGGE